MVIDYFNRYFNDAGDNLLALKSHSKQLLEISQELIDAAQNGKTIFWMGNGGSAADAQHLAAELVGRFEIDRRPISSIALTTDSSILTAIGNDFGFENIFARQIRALGRVGDVCIGITTSGRSKNVINALEVAKSLGIKTISFTGEFVEFLSPYSDHIISVKNLRTCHIQEAHIAIGQALCGYVERNIN
jgi:D-sedoheptulose 7-phosphate isomerase